MNSNRSIPACIVIPELAYPDVAEAAAWLCQAFGFKERLRIADHRFQLLIGQGGAMVVTQAGTGADTGGGTIVTRSEPGSTIPSPRELEAPVAPNLRHGILVRIDDANRHCARATRHGAKILRPPTDYPFGERQYTALDIGGHVWTFSESISDVDPSTWGGVLVRER